MTSQKAEALAKNPKIDFVEQDQSINLSSDFSENNIFSKKLSFNTTSSSQIIPWGVQRVGGPLDGTGKKAWVLDTGIDLNHDDLNVDIDNSASFIASENADDLNGHGTYVAGILAAINNSQDAVGVAAGATVVSVKVLDQSGTGTITSVCNGIDHVFSNASTNDVINMSLGKLDPDNLVSALDNAVINSANAGFRFTIAAGNDKTDANDVTPARVEHPNVWTVSAFREGDEFAASFDSNPNKGSNFSNPPIDFSAGGENIRSLRIGGGSGMGFGPSGSEDGTSYAAPQIAGLLLASVAGIDSDGVVSGDPDGNPDPIAVKASSSLSAVISGPSFVTTGQEGTWTVEAQGGVPPYEYDWQRNVYDPPHWEYLHDSDDSYSETVTEYFELRVEVTDATHTVIFTPVFTVATSSGSF